MAEELDREEGIRAIIRLQGLIRVEETRKEAEAGWDAMLDSEKSSTMKAYRILCGKGKKKA